MITTYDFYKETYFGDIIPAESFDKFESRAIGELHRITRGKLKGVDSYSEEIQKAACALAEVLYQIDIEKKNSGISEDGKGKLIKSVSSGSESISYEIQKSGFEMAVADKKVKSMLCLEAVSTYLSGTGLLYWGI